MTELWDPAGGGVGAGAGVGVGAVVEEGAGMGMAVGAGILRLPSGRLVRGRGLRRPLPAGQVPTFGVYLVGRPPPQVPWESRWRLLAVVVGGGPVLRWPA